MKCKYNMEKRYIELFRKAGIFKELPTGYHSEACGHLGVMVRQYEENAIICQEEEKIDKAIIVSKGAVRAEKIYLDGDVHLVNMYQQGEIFAVETAMSRTKISPLTYVVDCSSEVLFISISQMLRSKFASEFALALMHLLADDNIRKLYKIETLSKRGLRDRILTYLSIIQKKTGGEEFRIHMDQEQFAQYLCVNRSALSYELNQMRREGMIDFYKDKFKITIKK